MTLLVAAAILCALYTAYEIGRLVRSARDSRCIVPSVHALSAGGRIELFKERRRN